ncbi:MAG: phosphoribosylamine--glycine ligase [Bacteroidales bacterium]|nr:phosphoribosylamine--glycine ligase [Bacteroidales bacterium]
MNLLLIGSGGREHALAWIISKSNKLNKLYIAPGNAGTSSVGENININVNDFEALGKFSIKNSIDIVLVGPEDPLANGIHDYYLESSELKNIPVIGPAKKGAKLEGSKDFAKEFMSRHGIPTAKYKSVSLENLNVGLKFLDNMPAPYVLKADGLAAGKGVLILNSLQEAKSELKQMLEGKFGEASKKVVIEEFLSGIELSVFVLTDGKSYKILPVAKDYKRIGEGDSGLNTGGMGAVSPVPFADNKFMNKIEEQIIIPTIKGLQKENIPYKGFIFFGLINCNGNPYVIEYNVRMGDPEAEVVIPRLDCDFLDILEGVAFNKLKEKEIKIKPETCATVMMVSGGYPGAYEKGLEITNLEKVKNSIVFHAGTKNENNKVLTNGGRVIALSSFGKNFKEALAKSYENADIINFDKKYFRKDIGFDL